MFFLMTEPWFKRPLAHLHKPGAAIYFPCNSSPAIDCGIASLNNCTGMAKGAEVATRAQQ